MCSQTYYLIKLYTLFALGEHYSHNGEYVMLSTCTGRLHNNINVFMSGTISRKNFPLQKLCESCLKIGNTLKNFDKSRSENFEILQFLNVFALNKGLS